jgi:hypothetical protein
VRSNGDRHAASAISNLRISTETLPERDRFSAFQEKFAPKILQMDFIDRSARAPRMEVAFMRRGPVAVGASNCTPAEFVRYNHHLKDCSDGFRLEISPEAHSNSHVPARKVLRCWLEPIFASRSAEPDISSMWPHQQKCYGAGCRP